MSLMLKALQQLERRNAPHPRPADPLSPEEVAEVARRASPIAELTSAEASHSVPSLPPVSQAEAPEPPQVPLRRGESSSAAPIAVDRQLGEIEAIVARQVVEESASVPSEPSVVETPIVELHIVEAPVAEPPTMEKPVAESIVAEQFVSAPATAPPIIEVALPTAAAVPQPASEPILEQPQALSTSADRADETAADSRTAEIAAANAQSLSILQSAPKVSFADSFMQAKSALPTDVHPSMLGSSTIGRETNESHVHEGQLYDEVQQVDTIPLAWSAWRHRVIADLRQPQLHQQIRELAETVGRQLADSHRVLLLVSPTPDPAVARIAGHLVAARAQRTDGRTLLVAAGPPPELPDGLTEAVAQPDLGWEGQGSPEPRLATELFPGVDLLMIPWASDVQGEAQAIEAAIAILVNLRERYALTAIAGGNFDMPNLQWWCSVCDGAMLVLQGEVSNFAGAAAAAKWIRRQNLPLLGSVVTGQIVRSA